MNFEESCFVPNAFLLWMMFKIFHIIHKAEFQYHHIYDCDLNTCKTKKKKTLKFWKPWIWRKKFLFFLVLTRDRNNFYTKMSLSKHRNLRFSKFKKFVGNCDLKSWRSQKRSDMQRLFWNVWIFNMKKFIFKLHLRRKITTKLKILENMFQLSFWKCFFLEIVSLNMAFWRL